MPDMRRPFARHTYAHDAYVVECPACCARPAERCLDLRSLINGRYVVNGRPHKTRIEAARQRRGSYAA